MTCRNRALVSVVFSNAVTTEKAPETAIRVMSCGSEHSGMVQFNRPFLILTHEVFLGLLLLWSASCAFVWDGHRPCILKSMFLCSRARLFLLIIISYSVEPPLEVSQSLSCAKMRFIQTSALEVDDVYWDRGFVQPIGKPSELSYFVFHLRLCEVRAHSLANHNFRVLWMTDLGGCNAPTVRLKEIEDTDGLGWPAMGAAHRCRVGFGHERLLGFYPTSSCVPCISARSLI